MALKHTYILIALLIVLLGVIYMLNKESFSEGFITNNDIVIVPFAIYSYNPVALNGVINGYGWINDASYTQSNIFSKFKTDTGVDFPQNTTPPLEVATTSDITYYNANGGSLTSLNAISVTSVSGTSIIPKTPGTGVFYMKLKYSEYNRLLQASTDKTNSQTTNIIKLLDIRRTSNIHDVIYQIGPRIQLPVFINYTAPAITCTNILTPEVYLVKASTNIELNDLQEFARAFGGTVATRAQFDTAFSTDKAQWCAYGAFVDFGGLNADNLGNKYAFGFPIQDNTFLQQKYPNTPANWTWCGTPGQNIYNVAGNTASSYGVLIYGVKPNSIDPNYTVTIRTTVYSRIYLYKFFSNEGQDIAKERMYRCSNATTAGRTIYMTATTTPSSSSSARPPITTPSSSSSARPPAPPAPPVVTSTPSSSSSAPPAPPAPPAVTSTPSSSSSATPAPPAITTSPSSSSSAYSPTTTPSSSSSALFSTLPSSSSSFSELISQPDINAPVDKENNYNEDINRMNMGSSSSYNMPVMGSSSSSMEAGLSGGWDALFQGLGLSSPTTSQQQSCDAPVNGRKPAKITDQAPTTPDLPPQAPPLNMTFLLSTVAAFTTSSMSNDESSVMTAFIRKYGAIKRLPADDNDSILLIYTQYPNFYNNFYGILDENNKRVFRTANFDIQARLINSINQFNRDTMIALHYALDPNFVVEDVSDAAAAADAGAAEVDPSTAYSSIKSRIMQDIADAIKAQMQSASAKCTSNTNNGGSGTPGGPGAAGAPGAPGAAGAPGGLGAAGAPGASGTDAGSGPVPSYKPTSTSSSLPLVIPQIGPLDSRKPSSSSSSMKPLGPGGTQQKCQSSPSSCPNCSGGGCNVCGGTGSPSLGQGSNWKYMVLPSNSGAKCGGEPKKQPSLIWGE